MAASPLSLAPAVMEVDCEIVTKSIWDKIDETVAESLRPVPTIASSPENPNATVARIKSKNWSAIIRFCDIAGTIIWLAALTKVLIFDFDRWLLETFLPELSFLVDYRPFIFLGIFSIALLITPNRLFTCVYILLFPLIVLLWKIPRLLYRLRSWNILLAVLNAVQIAAKNFRRKFVLGTLECLAILMVLTKATDWIVGPAVVFLLFALIYHFGNAVVNGFRPSNFLASQQRIIKNAVESKGLSHAIQITDELRNDEIVKFDKTQLTQFSNDICQGLLVVKVLDLYAFLLRKYRRSSAGLIFGAMAFIQLLLRSVLFLAVINMGLWQVFPSQFLVSPDVDQPVFAEFLYYSLTSLYANTIPVISAASGSALFIAIFAGLYGPILLLALLVQLYFGYKQTRDDVKFGETIKNIESYEAELSQQLEQEYEVSLDEALRRLQQFGLGMSGILAYLATKFPSVKDQSG